MSFSYDPSLSTPKDQARLRLDDRVNTPSPFPIFQDEEINAKLVLFNFDEACAQLAESAAVFWDKQASTIDNGPIKYVWQGRAEAYKSLAVSIRSIAMPPPGAPPFTGSTAGCMRAPDLSKYRTD